jgi:microcystin degradation protein MlrC
MSGGDRPKRIALLGFTLESNKFAPVTTRRDFEELGYFEGEAMLTEERVRQYFDPQGSGFGGAMSRLRSWVPVPILLGLGGAGGPCDHEFFCYVVGEMKRRLAAAGPVDGVYIVGHGAGITTQLDDMDGPYFAMVRAAVGPDVPIVATLDLHGNISEEMVASADVLVSYLTNPHVDMMERAAEAAVIMDEMFRGMKPQMAFVRLPLVTPQVTQLTAEGMPYGDLIREGQKHVGEKIANVSILSGFAFSDSVHNGMAILVTARGNRTVAEAVANELARKAWMDRHRYVPKLISLDDAVNLALGAATDVTRSAIILADVADNPGGGGRGNTTWMLSALHEAGASGVFVGVFYDPELVAEATQLGVGAQFEARFNRAETSSFSKPFAARARVRAVTDGRFVGKHGTMAGTPVNLGRSCLVQIGGIHVAVVGIRQQIFEPAAFAHFGLDPKRARCFVVKSRGHFRAGFAHLVGPEHTFEVDCPGLTTPNLAGVRWSGLRRPVFPLDADTSWASA